MTKTSEFHVANHFVPQSYLRAWAPDQKQIFAYRTVVSHVKVPEWKTSYLRGVGYHEHLYTKIVSGSESDELEVWLDRNFESPAHAPTEKVLNGGSMEPIDWRNLIRFLAAQDLRTPTRMFQALHRWRETTPKIVSDSLKKHLSQLAALDLHKVLAGEPLHYKLQEFPLKISASLDPDKGGGRLRAEIVIGRGMWVQSIKHVLSDLEVLHAHRWTIFRPPLGMNWLTSDAPVVKYSSEDFTLIEDEGGWNTKGICIVLPIGPQHLMFTKVGDRPSPRGTRLGKFEALRINELIAQNAHRVIFSCSKREDLKSLRPRLVDAKLFEEENKFWKDWHENQKSAERNLWAPLA